MRIWGYIACGWFVLFAMLHIYWATGGSVGLASAIGADIAVRRPLPFVVFGLWGVALLLLVGAAFSVALVRLRPRGFLGWLGWLGGAVLLARGLLLEIVLLTGVGDVAASVGPLETKWSLILWNPWFMLGGLALILATITARRPPANAPRRTAT